MHERRADGERGLGAGPGGARIHQPGVTPVHRWEAPGPDRLSGLLLGVVFHASLSFLPMFIGWAVQDISTSPTVASFMTVSHAFRLETFFLLAGFLGRVALQRKGFGEFVRSRLLRIGLPFLVGWFILRPLLVSGWIMGAASLRGDVDVWAGLAGGFQSLATLPNGLLVGSHLWFLYYLAMITALMLAARGLLTATESRGHTLVRRADALIAWLADHPASVVLLAVPTAVMLWFMRGWGMDTPDQSLRPHVPSLGIYGGFFVLGWMLNRHPERIADFTPLSPRRWWFAGVGIASVLGLSGIEHDPAHPWRLAAHVAFVAAYALTMWSLVFLTLGLFRKWCGRPSAFVRYLADSSYWMYLIHLPIVVWLQVAVAEWPAHWSLKLAFIVGMTVALAWFTYDLFVRSTWMGWVLSGRRRDRAIHGNRLFARRRVLLPSWRRAP